MLALKYALFALISTGVNLLFQYLSFSFYDGVASLYVAMFVGTVAGLVAKYILDKNWIFYHTPKDKKDDAKKFMRYSFMGIFTTIIFWGTEMVFYYWIPTPNAKYVGAMVGLSIGYVIKYFLDRRFVFIHKEEGKV